MLHMEIKKDEPYVSLSGEVKTKCIRMCIVRKINVTINPFRAAFFFFFEGKDHFALKLKTIAYVSLLGKEERMYSNIFISPH